MTISKKHLKQRAYKRIARPAAKASTVKSLGDSKCKDTVLTHDHASNMIVLTLGNSPVGCGVWKYGKYLQPAKKTVQYVKQASLVTNVIPVAGPKVDNTDEAVISDNGIITVEFNGEIRPIDLDKYQLTTAELLHRYVDQGLMPDLPPGGTPAIRDQMHWNLIPTNPDGTIDLYAVINRTRTFNSGKSNMLGKMISDLKEKNPEVLKFIQYQMTDVEYSMRHYPESISITRGNEPVVLFDINRMDKALASETIHVPPGLPREEIRKLICDSAKKDDDEKLD